jgi:hypothetical protein|tara:strand:+ start:54 stop:605 length:552 start_codon:yes stop_codon:yes gene_type:complete
MNALKEWATIINALDNGKQTIVLRKGGILETASGFKIESNRFFLFPTWEHQETKHIKPEFQNFLDNALKNKPKEGFNKINSFAEVLAEKDIESKETINALSHFHIWSDTYIQERIGWMPKKPIKAVFLRTYTIPQMDIPLEPDFQGCKSWVEINSNFDSGQPVLTDLENESKLQKFMEIVNEV